MAAALLPQANRSFALRQRTLVPSRVNNCPCIFRNQQQVRINHFRLHCSAAETVSPADESSRSSHDENSTRGAKTSDRQQARKASPGPTIVAQSASAAAAGPLPDILSATFPDTFPTLSAARRVIRKDLVLVDGVVGSCKTEVTPGQTIQQLEAVAKHKAPRRVSLEVAFEDDSVAVVHKPWGVRMYGGDARRTITGALAAGALNPSTNPDALPEPKPVHRLDAAVGGLLVVAKTTAAVTALSAELAGRKVHKVYHALLSGRLDMAAAAANLGQWQQQQQGVTSNSLETLEESDDSIASETDDQKASDNLQQQQQPFSLSELLQLQLRDHPPFSTTAADLCDPCLEASTGAEDETSSLDASSSSSSGLPLHSPGVYVIDLPLQDKSCYTLLQVLGYSRCPRFGGWMTTVALSPVTGRKHQLRQHMAALGFPIVGDGKYAFSKEEHIGNQGIYLESLEVWFTHPESQQFTHIRIKEPQRFATLRQQQHNRWSKLQAAAAGAAA